MGKLSRTKGPSKVGSRRGKNKFRVDENVVTLITSKGYTAKISPVDFDLVKNYCWYASVVGTGKYYLRTTIAGKKIYLHRFLNPDWKIVDHINGDRSDNRRENLRETCPVRNSHNVKPRGRSGRVGVSWHRDGFWYGRVHFKGKCYHVGSFGLDLEACAFACKIKKEELLRGLG